jgi:hypothetical protein
MFLYWFRYTCVLILSARTSKDYGTDIATANQLSFVGVQRLLEDPAAVDLSAIEHSLIRDFEMVTSLMNRASQLRVGASTLEDVMLRIDFRIMQLGFSLSRSISQSRSRAALTEMSQIVAHFANALGESASAA